MNRFVAEFWNGFLKGVLAAEQELRELEEKTNDITKEGIQVSIHIIKDLKHKAERLHGEDVRNFLRQWK